MKSTDLPPTSTSTDASWIDDADKRGAWREYLEICRRKYDEAVGDISSDALTVLDAYEKLWEENARIEFRLGEERNLRHDLIIELSLLRDKMAETLHLAIR